MKRLWLGLGIAVVSLACILIFKDQVIKYALTSSASRITGSPVHMDGFSLNILNSTAHITGFKIYNPKGFPEGVLVSCPRVDVIFDWATIFKEKRHLLVVNIELAELVLIKNKAGKLNVDSLNLVHSPSASVPVQIDLVTLGIGKIISKDYRNDSEPDVRFYDVNKVKSYKSIPTAHQLIVLVMTEPMKAAGIKSAQIYGVTILAGVAVLPVAVMATFIGKTSVQQDMAVPFEQVFEVSLKVLERMGKVTQQDAANGTIQASIKGAKVILKLHRTGDRTALTISARKYFFPKLDIAGGVLYEISEKL